MFQPVSDHSRLVPYATTLAVRDSCLCLHVQRAARGLARTFDAALAPLDLTNGQFSLLMSLNRPEPPGMGPVAALLAMDRTTLTAALKPLQRRGLVEVTVDPQDRRGRLLVLTQDGLALLAQAAPVWERAHASLAAEIGPAEMEMLRSLLNRLPGGSAAGGRNP